MWPKPNVDGRCQGSGGFRRSAIPFASSVTLITCGTQRAVLFCAHVLQALEAAMSNIFMNWTSRVAIAGRIAERRRLQNCNELAMPGDYHLPFGKTEARAEAAKWVWQV